MQNFIFTIAITCISRTLLVRDRLFHRIDRKPSEEISSVSIARHQIQSGDNLLDAVLMQPSAHPAPPAILICHGIGEIVDHWFAAQRLLAENGIASLVFDYSGYGRSTGCIRAARCEEDAIAAFHFLERHLPSSLISLLGFSLGSGIAAAIVTKVAAHHLILCVAFSSLRKAARRMGIPRCLSFMVPPIWSNEEALRTCPVPVLILHGEKDRLFPVSMASDLAAACGPQGELVVIPDLAHNAPIYRPQLSYWTLVPTLLYGKKTEAH